MTRHTTRGHLTTCPNEILSKNYFLSFRFFNLAFFLCMFPPLWRSALSVAKDGTQGGGTDTSCPSGPEITPTRSTVSATSDASGADSWLSGGNPGASGASGGGSRATTRKAMTRLGGVTSATWQPSRVSSPSVEDWMADLVRVDGIPSINFLLLDTGRSSLLNSTTSATGFSSYYPSLPLYGFHHKWDF